MKIIKKGEKQKHEGPFVVMTCNSCGCVFEAGIYDYHTDIHKFGSDEINILGKKLEKDVVQIIYSCRCPNCGISASKAETENIIEESKK